jgi:hypothetical protein
VKAGTVVGLRAAAMLGAALSLCANAPGETGTLDVAVSNVRSNGGRVSVSICPESTYLKSCPYNFTAPAPALRATALPVAGASLWLRAASLAGAANGSAVAAWPDESASGAAIAQEGAVLAGIGRQLGRADGQPQLSPAAKIIAAANRHLIAPSGPMRYQQQNVLRIAARHALAA